MYSTNPRMAFDRAVRQLNSRNLFDLWTASCVLSCIEYFDSFSNSRNFLFPMLYPEKINILDRTILESKASLRKQKTLDARDVSTLMNSLNDTTSERVAFLHGEEDPAARLRRMLSTMAHQQIRFYENRFVERIGRVYALLDELPSRYATELQNRMGNSYFDIDKAFRDHTDLGIGEFLAIGFAVIALMSKRYESNITITDKHRSLVSMTGALGIEVRADALKTVIEETKAVRNNFAFRGQDLVLPDSHVLVPEKVNLFLAQVARTTTELRSYLRDKQVFSEGFIADRLNPLERYPVVKIDENQYVVPNMRFFDMAVTELVHHILQEAYPQHEYNRMRGHLQEIYIQVYIQSKLPNLYVIPEVSYRKGKNRLDGPDITIINGNTNSLVAIESKAKRFRVISRVKPQQNYFDEDMEVAVNALLKLPEKVRDMHQGLTGYEPVQEILDSTKGKPQIAVVVIGEGVYFLSELLNDRVKSTESHPLIDYPIPYCVLDLERFERAVEVAAQNEIGIEDALLIYWKQTRSQSIHEPSAEQFAPYSIEKETLTEVYASNFFSRFFKEPPSVLNARLSLPL